MKIKRRVKWIVIPLIFAIILANVCSLCIFTRLIPTYYTVPNKKLTADVRIVQLTDLHGVEFGEENSELITNIQSQKPDIIAMTGDMFNSDADVEEIDKLCQLITALNRVAPVFYSLGNHEIAYMESNGDAVLGELESAGAVVLEQDYEDISINGQQVRIGGAYGYLLSYRYRNGQEQEFMRDFTDTTLPTILLSHMSEGLLLYGSMEDWDVDLILSGHTHGGQIRLPFIGGLFSPETGLFPKYTKGMFTMGDSTLVLSAGLGSSGRVPRFNNPPELVVVDIIS